MPFETQSVAGVDITGTPDVPSPEAHLETPPYTTQSHDWATRAGHTIAKNPVYLLAGALAAGFVTGRLVKRLLSPDWGRYERARY